MGWVRCSRTNRACTRSNPRLGSGSAETSCCANSTPAMSRSNHLSSKSVARTCRPARSDRPAIARSNPVQPRPPSNASPSRRRPLGAPPGSDHQRLVRRRQVALPHSWCPRQTSSGCPTWPPRDTKADDYRCELPGRHQRHVLHRPDDECRAGSPSPLGGAALYARSAAFAQSRTARAQDKSCARAAKQVSRRTGPSDLLVATSRAPGDRGRAPAR